MNTQEIEKEHHEVISNLFKGGDKLLPELTTFDVSIIHAAFGMGGEAAELEEALLDYRANAADLARDPAAMPNPWDGIDRDNVIEELGDSLFYEGALRIVTDLEALPGEDSYTCDLWKHEKGPVAMATEGDVREVLCLLSGVLTVATGHVMDAVKRRVFYRKELNRDKLVEALREYCWTMESIASICGFSEKLLRQDNMDKLAYGKANKPPRYGKEYSDSAAGERADKVETTSS